MLLTPHVDALQRDLAAVAEVGGAQSRDAALRMSAALEASARLRLLEAVSQAVDELAPQLPEGRVELRLTGSDPYVAFVPETPGGAPAASDDEGLTARLTLRVPESLKQSIEIAASRERMSVNSWLIGALSRCLQARPRAVGKRLSGFARS